MFLTRQIKAKPDEVSEMLAKQKEQICSNIDSSVVTGDIWCSQPSERDIRIYDEA